jgi:hypothetical protein
MSENIDDKRYRMQIEEKKRIAKLEAETAKRAADYNNAMESGDISLELEEKLKEQQAEQEMDRKMKKAAERYGLSKGGEMKDDPFKVKYSQGGSMLTPPEREEFRLGSIVKATINAANKTKSATNKKLDKLSGVDEKSPGRTAEDRGVVVGKDRTQAFKTTEQIKGAGKAALVIGGGDWAYNKLTAKEKSSFDKAFSKAHNEGKETFTFEGKEFSTEVRKGQADGGSMLMSPEMPVDTYDNIPEDEQAAVEASQLPDNEMEEDYTEYVLEQSLDMEDQEYLMDVLEGDERLSSIFDKVMDVAGEFAGEGAVNGPGDGTSDSIPARLSDGEFVFTKKATDQLGADQLQTMMDDAERAYDGGYMKKAFGGMVDDNPTDDDRDGMYGETSEDEEIKKQMISSNRMPSVK